MRKQRRGDEPLVTRAAAPVVSTSRFGDAVEVGAPTWYGELLDTSASAMSHVGVIRCQLSKLAVKHVNYLHRSASASRVLTIWPDSLQLNAHPCDPQPGNSAVEGVLQHPLPAAVGLRPISTEI